MRSFSAGNFGNTDDPWFRVGNINVTTTIAFVGIGIVGLLVWMIEGPSRSISQNFWLFGEAFRGFEGVGTAGGGQIWRIFTWPMFHEAGARVFWVILMFAIFFMLGSQLEAKMGRKVYTSFIATLIVVPSILVTLIQIGVPMQGAVGGLRFVELGVLIGFGLAFPEAVFFFGIPARFLAAGIVVIEFIQTVADRNTLGLVFGFLLVATALLAIRAFGHAPDDQWIPLIPVPANLGGTAAPKAAKKSGGPNLSRPSRKRAKSNLSVVPPTDPVQDDLNDMEIDSLLDQVANEGLDSLTKDQRKRLEQHSKRLRKRDEGK